MEKVLLISANTERFPEPAFPLGAAYVARAIQSSGARVRIFDAGLHRRPLREIERSISEMVPDLVCISLRNIDSVSYPVFKSYLPWYESLLARVRNASEAPVLLGGSAFSIFPSEILGRLGADAGVTGDGEDGVSRYLRSRAAGIYKGCLQELSEVGFPEGLKDVFPEMRRYRTIGVQTARGCTHRCIYCNYPLIEGGCLRRRPPGAVAEEIGRLHHDHGKCSFFIVDSSFNADEGHMAEVARSIAALGIKIRFSCYMEPKVSDPSIFRLLSAAGCMAVEFGTDSASDDVLGRMKKGFNSSDISSASVACDAAGIQACHSLIFGGPGESEETIAETVGFISGLRPRAVMCTLGMRIYPGTELHTIAEREGQLERGACLLDPKFYFSGGDPWRIARAVREAVGARGNWFFPGDRDWGSFWFLRLVGFFCRGGPLWRTLPGEKHGGLLHILAGKPPDKGSGPHRD